LFSFLNCYISKRDGSNQYNCNNLAFAQSNKSSYLEG
jgi:hypothetical protein